MINYTSHWVVDIPLIVVSYVAWRKYKTTEFRRLFVLCVVMLLLGIWVYLVDRVFHFPPVVTLMSNIITQVRFCDQKLTKMATEKVSII